MVRSSSASKREEVPMKFTTFNVPPVINTKNVSSTYLRSESQTIWARNTAANAQRKRTAEEAFAGKEKEKAPATDGAPGSKTLVIHPGSRWLKIGMATDVFPVQVPNVIARRCRTGTVPPAVFHHGVVQPVSERNSPADSAREKGKGREMSADSEDPFTERTAGIRSSLLARMKFYKLETNPNGSSDAAQYNATVKPTKIPEHDDSSYANRVGTPQHPIGNEEIFIGNKALMLGEPAASSFTVKWPMRGNSLNTRDYDSAQEILSDIETIWATVLLEELEISRSGYKELNVILVIPDHFDRFYVRELANVLLVQMGFSQLCVQQESLCAAFGAGLSTACIVDIGASKTSIACVEEGQVVPDTRITLDLGGDDITEYLYYLLKEINFPLKNCQLQEPTTWNIMTKLKKSMCSLSETDVALNLYDFHAYNAHRGTELLTVQVYDEPIVAAMCIFEPRIIDFDAKKAWQRSLWTRENVEDVPDFSSDNLTQAMLISTQHLLPPQPTQTFAPKQSQQVPQVDGAHDADGDTEMAVPQQTETSTEKPVLSDPNQTGDEKQLADEQGDNEDPKQTARSEDAHATSSGNPPAQDGPSGQDESARRSASPTHTPIPPINDPAGEDRAPSVEIIAEPDATAKPAKSSKAVAPVTAPVASPAPAQIDVRWEASKLPLDVAIFNSTRAAGGVDRIKKFLQVVVIAGGTSMIPGMVHALESR
ncbi:putative actin-related protein 8 [Schizosaccharomyces pombe 972h-] [Rhizoctonia solani]|uniref:Putative actin-related protein 8 [Schizosaccharomyces pombe 972h-] n=1 Tax=Rhizoctonia solani TaxID=456999 RepID=A0A0K6G825_9AGAM|nr:putative actin-related protein 8 [Schizosaccharomyces pombe 972h-] [Rhizoctonia solani]